ncbi:MAG TPA: penicillin-binding protein 2, partial [Waddliaceae bacterium]
MPPSPVTSNDRKYLMLIALTVFFFFSLLVYQFYTLQIIEGEKWSQIAKKQHFFVIKEPSLRGSFYSNASIKKGNPENPQQFVFDIRKFHLYADPLSIPNEHHQTIAKQLLKQLELTPQERLLLQRQFSKNSRSRKLAMWLGEKERESVSLWWQRYAREHKIPRNALFFVPDYQRSYPFGKLLGQILHTVQQNKDATTQQALPTGGLELFFNHYLQGRQGKRVLMRSPRHSF